MTTAWLLGAGFSCSLGGPLLADFFTSARTDLIRPHLRRIQDVDLESIDELHEIFWNGADPKRGAAPWLRPWSDQEEFLSFLDVAARDWDSDSAETLRLLSRGVDTHERAQRLWRAAATYVAIATDHFVPPNLKAAKLLERWQPYIRWGNAVARSNDYVITFNYDRVPELVSYNELNVLDPSDDHRYVERPWLIKLHGSVNWWEPLAGDRLKIDEQATASAVLHGGRTPFIAMPGPTKYHSAERLRSLWRAAEDALETSDRVVMIGFRFPPGDSAARHRLLGAIRRNANSNLSVHIVLGSDTSHHDVRRVGALFEWISARREEEAGLKTKVAVEPLFGEDFLALYDV